MIYRNILFVMFSIVFLMGIEKSVDERLYTLNRELMCPVCDGQTIGESQASISNDMKNIIDLQISEGKTDKEILVYFEERYGTEILASPPSEGVNIVVWIAPIILLTSAFIIFLSWLRHSTKRQVQ